MSETATFFVLESKNVGFKVVYGPVGVPQGGRSNGNYVVIADSLRLQEAVDMVRRLVSEANRLARVPQGEIP